MRVETLDLICCAKCRNGQLAIDNEFKVTFLRNQKREVLEGLLCCSECGSKYPIVEGVAILVPDVGSYLSARLGEVVLATRAGSLSRAMRQHLFSYQEVRYPLPYTSQSWEGIAGVDMYIATHYGVKRRCAHASKPLRQILSKIRPVDIYHTLATMLHTSTPRDGKHLDVGCSVGGMMERLSSFMTTLLGIEYSFLAALTARRILISSPTPLRSFMWPRDGLKGSRDRIAVRIGRSIVDVVVGDALRLPVQIASFDSVSALHVLELTNAPKLILKECNASLAGGGRLLVSTPYYWRNDRTPFSEWFPHASSRSSSAELQRLLRSYGHEIILEKKALPWPLLVNQRYLQVWSSHVVLSRKQQ